MVSPRYEAQVVLGVDDRERSPPPRKPIRLADILFVLERDARRIRNDQEFFERRPEMKARVPESEILRAEVFEAALRLLEKMQPVFGQVLELIKSAEGGARTKVERGERDGGERQGAVR